MDNNSPEPNLGPADPSFSPGWSNKPNDTMPPVAPPHKRFSQPAEVGNYPIPYAEQQTLSRLMDSVHQGRLEEIHIGQYTAAIHIDEAQIINGSIEIQAHITPKSGSERERIDNPNNANSFSNYDHSIYPPPYIYQPPYQPQTLPMQQVPYYYQPTQLQPQYQYLNPVIPSQYPFRLVPAQLSAPYTYQYPLNNEVGSIANTINQLALTTRLLRR